MVAKAKTKIIDTAEDLFRTSGYCATGTNAIIAAAKVSKGSFFYHFPDKVALLLETLERYFDHFLEAPLIKLSSKSSHPSETLKAYIDQLERWAGEAGHKGGCLLGNMALEVVDTEPRVQAKIAELFSRWRRLIGSIVSEHPPLRGVDSFVTLFMSALQGVTMITRAHKDDGLARSDWQACRDLIDLTYPTPLEGTLS